MQLILIYLMRFMSKIRPFLLNIYSKPPSLCYSRYDTMCGVTTTAVTAYLLSAEMCETEECSATSRSMPWLAQKRGTHNDIIENQKSPLMTNYWRIYRS